ncbi:hypothetical protein PoB_002887400 [Plakobranchus ocellatus]|uniref:Uncharacterized protein n=1 Tax=Plakobranchus ocellatus TaxID=259542 RepID=A0AAV4A820_9GAST|nr:hypothetical protein PoB_002887400 [Plakobranchus ocellatus]
MEASSDYFGAQDEEVVDEEWYEKTCLQFAPFQPSKLYHSDPVTGNEIGGRGQDWRLFDANDPPKIVTGNGLRGKDR